MEINTFAVDLANNKISWNLDKTPISIVCDHLESARVFAKTNLVAVLVGSNNFPSTLMGYSYEGNLKFKVEAPEGFEFSYLTEHPMTDIAVVCTTNMRVDGWTDWHFSVEPSTGKLTRLSPAY